MSQIMSPREKALLQSHSSAFLVFSSTLVSASSSFLSSLRLQREGSSLRPKSSVCLQSLCRTGAQVDLAGLAEARWEGSTPPSRDLASRGQRKDAHIDLGHKDVQNRGAAQLLREKQRLISAALRLAHVSKPFEVCPDSTDQPR